MSIGTILWYAVLIILALCVATVMLFFGIALVLSWSYSLFGFIGPVAVLAVVWVLAYMSKF